MTLRFLVISDIHMRDRVIRWTNSRIEEHGIDAVMVLGDITHFGPPEWAGTFLSALDVPAYAIPGNCDPPLTLEWIERSAISLHRTKIELEGETFIGLGGSNPTIFDTPNEQSEEEIHAALRPLMDGEAIMVTHAPPYGMNDLTLHDRHAGSHALRELAKEFRPRVWLAGHIHEARGIVKENGTIFMNPGAAKNSYAGLLEIGDGIHVELLDKIE